MFKRILVFLKTIINLSICKKEYIVVQKRTDKSSKEESLGLEITNPEYIFSGLYSGDDY